MLSLQLVAESIRLNRSESKTPPRRHPYTSLLRAEPSSGELQQSRASTIGNRLLVILVDFQEEVPDNPQTTGNGKFFLEDDPAYMFSIGRPPHDRQYFLSNMEALRYYYLAASAGIFNLNMISIPRTVLTTLYPNLWPITTLREPALSSLFPGWRNTSNLLSRLLMLKVRR